jgi:hypothetical protein
MMLENLGRALVDEKYSKKRITKCRDSHCMVEFITTKE